jgi:hypothetical protein
LASKIRTRVDGSPALTRPRSIANGRDPGEHVAAVGRGVDPVAVHADLREQDVHSSAPRWRHEDHLAGLVFAAALPADLAHVG